MVNRQPCDECKEVFKRRSTPTRWNKKPERVLPPCETCWPGIHPFNNNAATLYARVSGQWHYHPVSGEPVSLKTTEIIAELQALCVPTDQWAIRLDGVRELANIIAKFWARERERLKEENG